MRLALSPKATDFLSSHDVPVEVVSVSNPHALPEQELVVTGLAHDDDTTLFVRSTKPGRVWELPGGSVEADETPRQALDREFLEETGHRVNAARPVMTFLWVFPESVVTQIVFLVEPGDRVQDPTDEIADMAWMDDVPDPVSFGDPARDVYQALIDHDRITDNLMSRRARVRQLLKSKRSLAGGAVAGGAILAGLVHRHLSLNSDS